MIVPDDDLNIASVTICSSLSGSLVYPAILKEEVSNVENPED